MMTCIIPISKAQSVFGLSCSHTSALDAELVFRGSMHISLAPLLMASWILCDVAGRLTNGSAPSSTMHFVTGFIEKWGNIPTIALATVVRGKKQTLAAPL